jgi:PAS domain S-box-containing protein
MKKFLRGLTFRIWLPFAISISVVLISLLVLYPQRQGVLFRNNFETELEQLSRTTALGVSLALKNNDFEGLSEVLNLGDNSSDLEFIAIVERDSIGGRTVFASRPEGVDNEKILQPDSSSFLIKSSRLSTGFLEGDVILAVSNEVIDRAIFEINYPIYIFLGILIAVSLGGFFVLADHMASPIAYLTQVSNRLQTGEYDLDIDKISEVTEIQELNDSLIELKNHLQKAKIQNEKFNLQLEEQILIRTQDLEQTQMRLFEAQAAARLGNYEIDLITGEWQNSPIIDEMFNIPVDFDRKINSWKTLLSEQNARDLIDSFYRCKLLNRSFRKDLKLIDSQNSNEIKWISITGAPVLSPDREIRTIRGTIQDISERKAIEKEIEKLSMVARRTFNGVLITDAELKITWANEGFLRLTGYELEEILGQTPGMFQFEKTDRAVALDIKERVLRGENVTAEILNRGKAGREYWLQLNIVPMREDSGEISGYMAVEVDISQLKENENLIQQQVALQNILIDISSTYINIDINEIAETISSSLEKMGRFVQVDRAYIFDYDFKNGHTSNTYEWCEEGILPEIHNLQQLPLEIFPEWVENHQKNIPFIVEDVKGLPIAGEGESNLRSVLEPQGIQSLITIPIYDGVTLQGFVGFDSVRSKRVYNKEEIKLLTLFGQMIVNVNQKQRVQKQLKIQEEKYRNVIANMNLGFLEVDNEDIIINANASFCEMSGYRLEELVGKTGVDVFLSDEEGKKLVLQKNLLRKIGQSDVYEVEVINKSGNRRWWLISGGPNYNDSGELIGSVGIHLDITDQKKLENEQSQLLQLTQNQNDRLKNFAHIVSHNLRSHAANLSGMVNFLEIQDKQFAANPFFQNFRDVINNLMESIHNLSEVADIQTNDSSQLDTINLVDIINSSILSVSALARVSEVNIAFDQVNDKIQVQGNLPYLESIVLNLLTNAIKYSDPNKQKQVRISIDYSAGWTIMSVADNGLGIDLNRQGRKMFGMYKTFHDHPDSRGIGLFITKNQIEAIGGQITVESQEGLGSTFKVYLKNQ